MISKHLIDAYHLATYLSSCLSTPIRIGECHTELDTILEKYRKNTWAYITAYNPYSRILTAPQNRERNENLRRVISSFTYFDGESIDPNGVWPSESSYLIIGVNIEKAKRISAKFQQNAFLFGEIKQSAMIIFNTTKA